MYTTCMKRARCLITLDGGVVCVGWLGRLQSCLKRANLNTAVDKNDEKSGLETKFYFSGDCRGNLLHSGKKAHTIHFMYLESH